MKINTDYQLVPSEDEQGEPIFLVRLLLEPYHDVFVQYGDLRFNEDKENDNLTIDFDYRLVDEDETPINDIGHFENVLGEILTSLLQSKLDEGVFGSERSTTDENYQEPAD